MSNTSSHWGTTETRLDAGGPKGSVMILEEHFTLSNGVEIPKLGLGTWLIPDDDTARVVRDAVGIGYRHVDTAQAYANDVVPRAVGSASRLNDQRVVS